MKTMTLIFWTRAEESGSFQPFEKVPIIQIIIALETRIKKTITKVLKLKLNCTNLSQLEVKIIQCLCPQDSKLTQTR